MTLCDLVTFFWETKSVTKSGKYVIQKLDFEFTFSYKKFGRNPKLDSDIEKKGLKSNNRKRKQKYQ